MRGSRPKISTSKEVRVEMSRNKELRDKHFEELTRVFTECVKNPAPNATASTGTVIRKDIPEIIELAGLPVIVFPTENVNGEINGQQIYWTGV